MGHAGVGWVMKGWSGNVGVVGSCRDGMGHTGVGGSHRGWGHAGVVWVIQVWGGSCWGGVGWVMVSGVGHAGVGSGHENIKILIDGATGYQSSKSKSDLRGIEFLKP